MADPDLFNRARKLKADAVAQLLTEHSPAVYRLAMAMAGDRGSGERVARTMLQRAIRRLPDWKHPDEVQRWFHHHTVLLTRTAASEVDPRSDVLVSAVSQPSPQYVAFVRALRLLPPQPREAILLHHAEGLDPRAMAVAMDCSMQAAANHLAVGRRDLQPVAGDDLDRLLAEMRQVYQSLTPQDSLALPLVRKLVRRHLWPRRIWRIVRLVLILAILAAIGWAARTYLPIPG